MYLFANTINYDVSILQVENIIFAKESHFIQEFDNNTDFSNMKLSKNIL